jgi:thioredoxin 1
MTVSNILTEEDLDYLVSNNKYVLVDFWAERCGPCKMMAPVLDSIEEEHGWLYVVKINADELPQLAKKYDISSIPTLLLFREGSIIKYTVGAQSKTAIKRMLENI